MNKQTSFKRSFILHAQSPETEFFLYYSKNINGKKYWANVKMHKDYHGEVLYTIEPKKPEDLIEGKP